MCSSDLEETLTSEETLTPEETPAGITSNVTPDTTGETPVEMGPPIVIGTDTAPAETPTVELPTFTPLQAAQVDSSPATPVPLSLTGVIVALAFAGFLAVLRRNRQ